MFTEFIQQEDPNMKITTYQIMADRKDTFTESYPIFIKKPYLDITNAEAEIQNYKKNNIHQSKMGLRDWFEIENPWDINKDPILVYNLRIEERSMIIEFEDVEVEVFECLPKAEFRKK
jgi:hypothetical protein